MTHNERFLCRHWPVAPGARGPIQDTRCARNSARLCTEVAHERARHFRLRWPEFAPTSSGDSRRLAAPLFPATRRLARVARTMRPDARACRYLMHSARQRHKTRATIARQKTTTMASSIAPLVLFSLALGRPRSAAPFFLRRLPTDTHRANSLPPAPPHPHHTQPTHKQVVPMASVQP